MKDDKVYLYEALYRLESERPANIDQTLPLRWRFMYPDPNEFLPRRIKLFVSTQYYRSYYRHVRNFPD